MKKDINIKAAILYWIKLGFISFGGPTGQISLMHEELVERRKWVSDKNFLHALNYTMLLPGPEAQQLATYLGWLLHGRLGGIIAGTFFILPSFFILILLSYLYINYSNHYMAEGILYGIRAGVIAIIFVATIKIAKKVLYKYYFWLVAIGALYCINFLELKYPLIILMAGLIGVVVQILKSKTMFQIKITPILMSSLKTIIFGIMLWAIGIYIIYSFNNKELLDLSLFFSKASVVTFGGAYSVLPYVYQNAIESYGWLTHQQMMDGLALGESTPGPLIMIVTFVGFLVGWLSNISDGSSMIAVAILFAFAATFFTFLASFVFIFAGAPLIEHTKKSSSLDLPLKFITSAVVGMILNLGIFLTYKTIFLDDGSGEVDLYLIILIFLSFLALEKGKVGMIPLLITAGLTGMMVKMYF